MTVSPTDGMLLGFRTEPLSEFAPPETNRYGVIKVIGSNNSNIVVALLDGVFDQMPNSDEVRNLEILRQTRLNFDNKVAVLGVLRDFWDPKQLLELTFLNKVHVLRDEVRYADRNLSYKAGAVSGHLNWFNRTLESEWRWAHDRVAFIAEQELLKEKYLAISRAKEERYKSRLRDLTWEQMLSETPFESWADRESLIPSKFTSDARKKVFETIRSIQALGKKPAKKLVRQALKECVLWFNDADNIHSGPIETDEREEICALLEEIAFVSKHKSLTNEIDEWRSW